MRFGTTIQWQNGVNWEFTSRRHYQKESTGYNTECGLKATGYIDIDDSGLFVDCDNCVRILLAEVKKEETKS